MGPPLTCGPLVIKMSLCHMTASQRYYLKSFYSFSLPSLSLLFCPALVSLTSIFSLSERKNKCVHPRKVKVWDLMSQWCTGILRDKTSHKYNEYVWNPWLYFQARSVLHIAFNISNRQSYVLSSVLIDRDTPVMTTTIFFFNKENKLNRKLFLSPLEVTTSAIFLHFTSDNMKVHFHWNNPTLELL